MELGAAVAATAVASAYSPSSVRLPSVCGQTAGRIIQVGIEQYPVDFEKPITSEEVDKDAIDNVYPVIRSSGRTEGHLYVKRDSKFTKFIADFPTSVSNPNGSSFRVIFFTGDSMSEETGAEGVYQLYLQSNSPNGQLEEVYNDIGIPFSRDFHRPEDYDWRYFFAPSPLNSKPHVQVKAEFKTDIILRSDNTSRDVPIYNSYVDHNGILAYQEGTKLRFIDQTVAEPFGATGIALILSLAAFGLHRTRKRRISGIG